MATNLATTNSAVPTVAADIERVLMTGDLGKLTTDQRLSYYNAVCSSVGLNPLTRPFDYLTLQGKTILYARKDATEQLRKTNGVSLRFTSREILDDCYVVTAEATDKTGRVDSATGAVSVAGLRGEAKANALMKAETKAKRRVTLSICGLGLLDESEVSSIPGAAPFVEPARPTPQRQEYANAETGEIVEPQPAGPFDYTEDFPPALRLTEAELIELITLATEAGLADVVDGETLYPRLFAKYAITDLADLPPAKLAEAKDGIAKIKAAADRKAAKAAA